MIASPASQIRFVALSATLFGSAWLLLTDCLRAADPKPTAAAADPSALPWPPELPGLQDGVATIQSAQLLEIPPEVASQREMPDTASFVVAKTAPRVELAFHDQLGPGAIERRLWSSWGDICVARDGRVYCGLGDHGNDVGGDARCFIYRWDPAAHRLKQVVDMNLVVKPQPGQPAWSKVHAKIDEGPDGRILFCCTLNDGNKGVTPLCHWTEQLPGGQLYQFDPATGRTTVLASLPPKRCTATSLIDSQRGIWWCNLEGGGNALFGLDLKTGQVKCQAPDGSMGFNRAFALTSAGQIVFNGEEGKLMRLDPATAKISATNTSFAPSPGMRCATRESKDGKIYGSTQLGSQLYCYDVAGDRLKLLGKNFLDGQYTTVCELSPDERFLYYLPGSHGGAFKIGTPVVQYELATGQRKVLCFLVAACQEQCHYVPAGTYGMKVSADGSTLFVNFNGHPTDAHRPVKMKPIGFGLTAFAAIHIPASER